MKTEFSFHSDDLKRWVHLDSTTKIKPRNCPSWSGSFSQPQTENLYKVQNNFKWTGNLKFDISAHSPNCSTKLISVCNLRHIGFTKMLRYNHTASSDLVCTRSTARSPSLCPQALAVMRFSVKRRPKNCFLYSSLSLSLLITDSGIICRSSSAVLFSLCGRVLSCQQPVTGVVWALHFCSTLGAAAAERGAQACAQGLSEQYKHDAVGCSLGGVANSLWRPNRAAVIDYYTPE